jgi:phage-related protein
MAENTLEKLKSALQELSGILDDSTVKTALGAIPASIKTPIVEGLKTVLNVVKNTLKELKDKINSVVNLQKLFATTTKLLEAVEGLAPDRKSTLEEVKTVVNTVQDVANAQQEIEAILTQIDQIVQKLAAV